MDFASLLPILVMSGMPKTMRPALAEQLLPMTLPGPRSQQLAFAAITVDRQLKRQALNEQRLVEDAIKAGAFKKVAELDKFPALAAAFKRLPAAVQSALLPDSQTC
jgi:hypothetical protein